MKTIYNFMDAAAADVPGRTRSTFPEITDEYFWALYKECSPYSMVHVTGFFNAYQSMMYIKRNKISGDFVECGCFLGGMGIFIALLRDKLELHENEILLLDTFEGFPDGQQDALVGHAGLIDGHRYPSVLNDVKENFNRIMPGVRGVKFVQGAVEQTIPCRQFSNIALLRLDTDFYSSTKTELEHLYPKLVEGGVLIIDDYGTFQGSRRATDEFIDQLAVPPLLNRIDMSVWSGVKP